jgi:hypothetical protein
VLVRLLAAFFLAAFASAASAHGDGHPVSAAAENVLAGAHNGSAEASPRKLAKPTAGVEIAAPGHCPSGSHACGCRHSCVPGTGASPSHASTGFDLVQFGRGNPLLEPEQPPTRSILVASAAPRAPPYSLES